MSASLRLQLLEAMDDMKGYTKDNHVAYGSKKYDYEDFAQVNSIVNEALAIHGLAYYQRMESTGYGTRLITYVCERESGECMEVDSRTVCLTDDPQANGSAETYARRYALKTVFRLVEADDDGETAHKAAQPKKVPQKASGGLWDKANHLMQTAISLGCKEEGIRAGFANFKTDRGYDVPAIENYIQGLIDDQMKLKAQQ